MLIQGMLSLLSHSSVSRSSMSTDASSSQPTLSWTETLAKHDRVIDEIAKRRERIASTLRQHGIPYALVGGQAVAAWVASVDPNAVRTTKDVDILLDRHDLSRARAAALAAGFEYYEVMNVGMFLERDDQSPKKAVHIVWANQLIKPGDVVPAPSTDDATVFEDGLSVVSLDALVRMKLSAWRRHDQVHVEDLIKVGLVDASWRAKLPPELATRLQHLLDTPDG
jgi:transposase InsO family protein